MRVTSRVGTSRPDTVDANLEVWSRELPELDLETEGIIERIHRLERFVDRAMQETLDAFEHVARRVEGAREPPAGGPALPWQARQARQPSRSLERRDDEPPRQHGERGASCGGSTTRTIAAA